MLTKFCTTSKHESVEKVYVVKKKWWIASCGFRVRVGVSRDDFEYLKVLFTVM